MFINSNFYIYRCKEAKVINREVDEQNNLIPQDINIDGEDLKFHKFFKYICKHRQLEIVVDFNRIFETTYLDN